MCWIGSLLDLWQRLIFPCLFLSEAPTGKNQVPVDLPTWWRERTSRHQQTSKVVSRGWRFPYSFPISLLAWLHCTWVSQGVSGIHTMGLEKRICLYFSPIAKTMQGSSLYGCKVHTVEITSTPWSVQSSREDTHCFTPYPHNLKVKLLCVL